ncbi:MAG: hypothetical protein ACRDT2_10785, partial [Natronosporangium sp.]
MSHPNRVPPDRERQSVGSADPPPRLAGLAERAVERARLARVALTWLVEPGSRALWLRVAEHGPERVLD